MSHVNSDITKGSKQTCKRGSVVSTRKKEKGKRKKEKEKETEKEKGKEKEKEKEKEEEEKQEAQLGLWEAFRWAFAESRERFTGQLADRGGYYGLNKQMRIGLLGFLRSEDALNNWR